MKTIYDERLERQMKRWQVERRRNFLRELNETLRQWVLFWVILCLLVGFIVGIGCNLVVLSQPEFWALPVFILSVLGAFALGKWWGES